MEYPPLDNRLIQREITEFVNRNGLDARIGLPDYVIAEYLMRSIYSINEVVRTNKDRFLKEGK